MSERNMLYRRLFIREAAGATVEVMGFPLIVASSALGDAEAIPPERCISADRRGGSNMKSFLREKDCQTIAACDFDKDHTRGAVNHINSHTQNYDCISCSNYQKLLSCNTRFNPETEEILYDATAASLLGKSKRSPWQL